MDLQSRKIAFVRDFLNLQNEEPVSRLEKLLNKETAKVGGDEFNPMTKKELNKRIDQSEADFKNNRFKKSSEIFSKYK